MRPQAERLLEYFESGRRITRLDAYQILGIFELSARVVELEKKGHVIDKNRITVINRFNEKIRVMEYWIKPSVTPRTWNKTTV